MPRRSQSTLEARARRVPRTAAKIGWRFWGITPVDGAYRLCSPFRSTPWPTDEPLTAECLGTTKALGAPRRGHDAPSARCRCGIYGGTYRALRTFLSGTFVPPAEAGVLGRVLLWGTVVEEEYSCRASHAYPDRLLVPTLLRDPFRIAVDLEAYRVPVEVLDAAGTFATLHPTATLRVVE